MRGYLKRFLRIQNSFLLVLILTQLLIVLLSILFTRIALHIIETNEAEKRASVTNFVTNRIEQGSTRPEMAILAIAANDRYMQLFQRRDRAGLLAAAAPLFADLKTRGVRQFGFDTPDFKTFLRVHDPSLYGDDISLTRPMLVTCLTGKQLVTGLEQGRNGWGFRAIDPARYRGAFIGCVELGSDVDQNFLESLNSNYPGKWAIINLQNGISYRQNINVVASVNEPPDSDIFGGSFSTPDAIIAVLKDAKPYYEYHPAADEVVLYIPIKDYKGDVALYVRYISRTPYFETIRTIVLNAVIISLVSMLLCGLILYVLYRQIRNPVLKLVEETERIKNFDLKDKVDIKASLSELEVLIDAVGDMKTGLQSFQKYVPASLVRQLIETNQEARIGGRLTELTVLFTDVANFTSITENLSPNELTIQLSEYFDEVTNAMLECKGTVDKYIGDAIMAFWGAPIEMEDHARQACRAALQCQRRIAALTKRWKVEGRYEFRTRIGINTGEIVVGNIGSEQRLSYTVIGDAVNLASRLEGLNKEYHTSIIISGETYEHCKQHVEVRFLDFVTVVGKSAPVKIYELIGERGDVSPRQKEFITAFRSAIDAYLDRDWDRAIDLFQFLSERDPDDYPVKLYLERCQIFKKTPPGVDWKGEHTFQTK
jgi:class 3 adenylate cyclase